VLAVFYSALFIVTQKTEGYAGCNLKEKEMCWAYTVYGREEKYVLLNLRETRQHWWEDFIKTSLNETGWDDMSWNSLA
jgi:hypothetical protein